MDDFDAIVDGLGPDRHVLEAYAQLLEMKSALEGQVGGVAVSYWMFAEMYLRLDAVEKMMSELATVDSGDPTPEMDKMGKLLVAALALAISRGQFMLVAREER